MAATLNKVMIIGRLGRDPEVKQNSTGNLIVGTLNVATDESYTDRSGNRQERTEWHRVVVFQKIAEACGKHLSKGSLVFVEGKLQTRDYTDKASVRRFITEIRATAVHFLDRGKSESGEGDAQNGDRNGYAAREDTGGQRYQQSSGYMDDIPF